MKLSKGSLVAGLIFVAMGIGFTLEALGVWDVRVGDLRAIGPLTLVVIGVLLILGAIGRSNKET